MYLSIVFLEKPSQFKKAIDDAASMIEKQKRDPDAGITPKNNWKHI